MASRRGIIQFLYVRECVCFERQVDEVFSSSFVESRHWFLLLRCKLRSVWQQLLRNEGVDLSDATPYLIRVNEDGPAFKDLGERCQNYAREWLKRANFVTLEIFLYRLKMMPFSAKLKNLFYGGRKKKRV